MGVGIRLPGQDSSLPTFGNRQIFTFQFSKLALPDMRRLMLWTGALYEISQGFKAPDKLIASLFEPVLCGVPDH